VTETKAADLLMGVIFLSLGLVVFFASRSLPSARFGLGSGGYPMTVGVMLAILGLVQTVTSLAKWGLPKFSFPQDKRELFLIGVAAASTFMYLFLLRHLGFLLLTPIYLFGFMILFGYRKYITAGIVSLCVSTGIFFLFTRVFLVFLPEFNLF
jgi:putative tricarboxylic transport membrane protein